MMVWSVRHQSRMSTSQTVCLDPVRNLVSIQHQPHSPTTVSRFAARATARSLFSAVLSAPERDLSRCPDQLFSRLRSNKAPIETLHRRTALFLPDDTFTGFEKWSARAQLHLRDRNVLFPSRLSSLSTTSKSRCWPLSVSLRHNSTSSLASAFFRLRLLQLRVPAFLDRCDKSTPSLGTRLEATKKLKDYDRATGS